MTMIVFHCRTHLLAFSLVDTLSQHGESEEIFRYAAGGFRDFTRIASSDPQMWHDIFMTNGNATVKMLDAYIKDLEKILGDVGGDLSIMGKLSPHLKSLIMRSSLPESPAMWRGVLPSWSWASIAGCICLCIAGDASRRRFKVRS